MGGYVYILTNPCLKGWVKIGMTEQNDLGKRVKQLNDSTAVPLSFRVFATYETADSKLVEKALHVIIDKVDSTLRARETLANGKIREREFFAISEDDAYDILLQVARLRGEENNVKKPEKSRSQIEEENIAEEQKRVFAKGGRTTFDGVGVAIGSELEFVPDSSVICKTVDAKKYG